MSLPCKTCASCVHLERCFTKLGANIIAQDQCHYTPSRYWGKGSRQMEVFDDAPMNLISEAGTYQGVTLPTNNQTEMEL